jgi:hypothetical protein
MLNAVLYVTTVITLLLCGSTFCSSTLDVVRVRDEIPKLEIRNEIDEIRNTKLQGGPAKLQDVVSNDVSDILDTSNPKFEPFWGKLCFVPNDPIYRGKPVSCPSDA